MLVTYLKSHPHITNLNVSGNNLNDQSSIALISVTSLKQINFNYNNITAKGLVELLKSNIERLALNHNKIIIEDDEFVDILTKNKSLRDLAFNQAVIPD